MKRKLFCGFVAVCVFLNLLIGFKILTSSAATDDHGIDLAAIAGFTRAIQVIRQDYVDQSAVSYKKLTYAALHAMLPHLDPHSQFLEPEDLKDREDETRGQFGGFGFTISRKDQSITVLATMENSPSARAGILPGDQIVAVAGKSTLNLPIEDLNQMLRGQPSQRLVLTIYRPSTKETKDYEMRREMIKVASVVGAKILNTEETGGIKIGYLRITEFTEPTAHELAEKLDSLQAAGMQALIMDLRFNPGGLLKSAVDVCGLFLPPKTLVAYTEGRDAAQRREYFTDKADTRRPDFPMAVLANGLSASGAEIVTGALKDLKRAVIVGETTFGKGVVQTPMPLPDGSALWLTTAKYYTPGKKVIQEKGIAPDIESTIDTDRERALLLRQRGGLLTPEEQKLVQDKPDTQLQRAEDALRGLIVYNRSARQ
ncbi:MAG: S41 family peptidase [Verrucomicrobia bacterium]|nr:S41 family peptidase [Verrucomicrobiota bacterium]MBV9643208.1 S41 family peptidase [Verrucomicrobiota bacterium]